MSNLLEQASLVLIPSGYKEDVVYSQIPLDGSADMTLTRASNGTRVNSAGLVEVCPWNLYTYSEVFSNSIWANGNATITDNTTTAPNGTLTADSIFEQSVNDYQIRGQNYSMVSGQQFTFSIYAKANTRNFFRILVGNGVLASNQSAYFDLVNVTTTSTSLITSSITSVGDGWCKIVISFTCNATATDAIYFGPAPNMTSGYLPFVGNASNGVYIWGAQLNIGSTAKPYFPTTDRLNVPRLTYQNGGGGCPSLLLEKQSTNYIKYSEDLSQADWNKENAIISTNATTSPDGTTNADKLIADSVNTDHTIYQSNAVFSGASVSFSAYAKASDYNYIFLGINNSIASDGVFFNLTNGTISQNTSGLTASIQSVGNGWYRCIVSSSLWTTPYAIICLSQNGTSFNFAGDSSKGVFVWGAQAEGGSYPTSYIPTTSASATRVADACSKTGISSLIGQTQGTILWDIQVDITSATESILNLDAGSFANTIYLIKGSLGTVGAEMYASSILQSTFTLSSITAGRYKMAIGYANNNTAFFVNGVQVGTTDTSCSVPAMSRLQMGNTIFGASDGKVNQAILFPTRLTNAELASLTTI